MWSAGTARSPVRGVVDLGVDMSPDTGPAFLQCTSAREPAPNQSPPNQLGRRSRPRTRRRAAEWKGASATPSRQHPRRPGVVPVPGQGRARHLCGQGQVAAQPAVQLLSEPGSSSPADRPDGGSGRERRVDPGPQRRRGRHARVQPDQAAQAPVQRPAAGRQELSLFGRNRERRVAPGPGAAWHQRQGQPVLRAVRPCLCHPGDA